MLKLIAARAVNFVYNQFHRSNDPVIRVGQNVMGVTSTMEMSATYWQRTTMQRNSRKRVTSHGRVYRAHCAYYAFGVEVGFPLMCDVGRMYL